MHKVVIIWWCEHICKGGEKEEEEEAKLGSGCRLGGIVTHYPVHRHLYGGTV